MSKPRNIEVPIDPSMTSNFEVGHVVEWPPRWWNPFTWRARRRRLICVAVDRVNGVITFAKEKECRSSVAVVGRS